MNLFKMDDAENLEENVQDRKLSKGKDKLVIDIYK